MLMGFILGYSLLLATLVISIAQDYKDIKDLKIIKQELNNALKAIHIKP